MDNIVISESFFKNKFIKVKTMEGINRDGNYFKIEQDLSIEDYVEYILAKKEIELRERN